MSLVFVLALITLVSVQLASIQPVYASPSSTYASRPTAHLQTGVTNPTYAYDGSTGTYATFVAKDGNYLNLTTFTKLAPQTWRIVRVDFKIRYSLDSGGNDEMRIEAYVGPSTTQYVLQDWIGSDGTGKSLATYSWPARPEPNNGIWEWADVGNIRIGVVGEHTGKLDNKNINVYEVWAVVYYRNPTMFVDPATQTVSASFSININVTNADDIYAWEFKLSYNTTALTATNVVEGSFLSAGGSTQFNKTINDAHNATHGVVYAYCSLIGDVQGVSGSGTLAIVSFNIDAGAEEKTYDLNLHEAKFVEYDYLSKTTYNFPPYPFTVTDGTVSVIPAVPEFPLGAAMEIALAAVIVFYWLRRRQKLYPTLP